MTSPGCSEFLFHPRRRVADGLPASPAQCAMLPLSSFTSNMTMLWGLAHTNFVTVASFKTTILSSYAAAPWCANSGPQIVNAPTSKTTDISRSLFIWHLAGSRSRFDRFDPEIMTANPSCQLRRANSLRLAKPHSQKALCYTYSVGWKYLRRLVRRCHFM